MADSGVTAVPAHPRATDFLAPPMTGTELRVGTDIVDVRSIEASIERFGQRYLARVFTDDEIAYCRSDARGGAERFAARFAAKEAALKVLRPDDWRPEWRHIEVVRTPGGWCDIQLRGPAATLAEQQGVQIISCSLAHESSYATAVVIGSRNVGSSDPLSSFAHA